MYPPTAANTAIANILTPIVEAPDPGPAVVAEVEVEEEPDDELVAAALVTVPPWASLTE
jgi:hypothetical protein